MNVAEETHNASGISMARTPLWLSGIDQVDDAVRGPGVAETQSCRLDQSQTRHHVAPKAGPLVNLLQSSPPPPSTVRGRTLPALLVLARRSPPPRPRRGAVALALSLFGRVGLEPNKASFLDPELPLPSLLHSPHGLTSCHLSRSQSPAGFTPTSAAAAASAPMAASAPPLDDCLRLLRGERDEQKLAGLLVAANVCRAGDADAVRKVYDAVGPRFLRRLLNTGK